MLQTYYNKDRFIIRFTYKTLEHKYINAIFFVSFYFYYRMCAVLLPETSSFAAAMLFAVHPIHTEAVSQFFRV